MSQIFKNDSKSTSTSVIGAGDLIIQIVDATTFPVLSGVDYSLVTIEIGTSIEIIKLIAPGKTGNSLIVDPVGRGWEGTTPLAFPVGSRVEGRITAGTLNTIVSSANTEVSTETANRLAADNLLQIDIAAETLARTNAISITQTNINNEAATRLADDTTESGTRSSADIALQNNINLLSNGIIGSVAFFASSTAPTGWVKCNGSAVSSVGIYANLFAVIGVTFGSPGPGLFYLPDFRGEFLRGFDDGRGVDAARVLGSWQAQAIQSHTHTYNMATSTAPQSGSSTSVFIANSSQLTGATGGTETRPRNIALLACIKY